MKYFALLPLLLLWTACSPGPSAGKQVRIDTNHKIITDYWLYLPKNYDEQRSYPLIFFLQGASGNNRDPRASANNGPARFAKMEDLKDERLKTFVKDSFIIVNPHMTAGIADQRQWHQYDDMLLKIIEEVAANQAVDSDRIYLTGLSKGARGGFVVLKNNPDVFAAGLFTAGSYNEQNIESTMTTPLLFTHNEADDLVDIKSMQELVKSYISIGRNFNSTFEASESKSIALTLPYEGHDSWTWTYSQPEIYAWLLNQSQ